MVNTNSFFNWLKTKKIHLIGWSAYIVSEVGLVGIAAGSFGNIYSYTVHYFLHICLFYFHAHVVLEKSFNTRRNSLVRFVMFFTLELSVYVSLRAIIHYGLFNYQLLFHIEVSAIKYQDIFQFIWRGIFFCGLSSFYYLFLEYQKERTRREEADRLELLNSIKTIRMQDDLNRAKYAYLKAQMHPHLLFNTLSYLYDSVRLYNDDAGEAVQCLSELMRFSLNTNNQNYPELKDELEQIENLKRLHEIRQDYNLYLDLVFSKEIKEICFIPLVVITLVENMFKHGNLAEKSMPGKLEIEFDGIYIRIKTANIKNTKINESGFNKGLENIQNRLQLMYADNAEFRYYNEGRYFITNLTVDLSD